MTNLQPGDYIHHRGSYAIWHVLVINSDGTLEVEFYAGSRHTNWQLKTIRRPEEYRKVENDIPAAIPNSPMGMVRRFDVTSL